MTGDFIIDYDKTAKFSLILLVNQQFPVVQLYTDKLLQVFQVC